MTNHIKDMDPPDNKLVIWLDYQTGDSFEEEMQKEDPKYESAPTVVDTLDTTEMIISGFTADEAKDMASIINTGALPVNLKEINSSPEKTDETGLFTK